MKITDIRSELIKIDVEVHSKKVVKTVDDQTPTEECLPTSHVMWFCPRPELSGNDLKKAKYLTNAIYRLADGGNDYCGWLDHGNRILDHHRGKIYSFWDESIMDDHGRNPAALFRITDDAVDTLVGEINDLIAQAEDGEEVRAEDSASDELAEPRVAPVNPEEPWGVFDRIRVIPPPMTEAVGRVHLGLEVEPNNMEELANALEHEINEG